MADRARGRGRKTDLRWLLTAFTSLNQSAGSAAQAELTVEGISSETLFRIRGNWRTWLDTSASSAGDVVRVAIGILLQQSGATATSLPLTDGEAPWVFFDVVTLGTESAVGAGAATLGVSSHLAVVDNKAMRRIKPNQTFVCVVETTDVIGAPVINTVFDGRMLVGS